MKPRTRTRIRKKLPLVVNPANKRNKWNSYDKLRYPSIGYSVCKNTGADNVTLGEIFNVGPYTIKNWMNKYPEFRDAVQKGRDEYDTEVVERRLLDKALGFKYHNKTYERMKTGLDDNGNPIYEMVLTKIEEKQNAPDTVALLFWLKNRNLERWRDVNRKSIEFPDGPPVTNIHQHSHEHLTQVSTLILENASEDQLRMLDGLIEQSKDLELPALPSPDQEPKH